MEHKEMTEAERNAYNRGSIRWGIGGACVMILVGWVARGLSDGLLSTVIDDQRKEGAATSVLSSAQASEPDRKDLFALMKPADACQGSDDVIAWQRDDRFATKLRVWCVEDSNDEESNLIVVWSQVENQHFASRYVIQEGFYTQKMYIHGEDKKPYVDACGGDGFLGWSMGGSSHDKGGVTRRTDGDRIQITGFYGGNLWCLGDDLYVLLDALKQDDNRTDRRLDIAKGVETSW